MRSSFVVVAGGGAERDREREASFFPLPKILRVSSAAHGAERKAEERGRMGAVTTYSFGVASFCILGIYRPRTAARRRDAGERS